MNNPSFFEYLNAINANISDDHSCPCCQDSKGFFFNFGGANYGVSLCRWCGDERMLNEHIKGFNFFLKHLKEGLNKNA